MSIRCPECLELVRKARLLIFDNQLKRWKPKLLPRWRGRAFFCGFEIYNFRSMRIISVVHKSYFFSTARISPKNNVTCWNHQNVQVTKQVELDSAFSWLLCWPIEMWHVWGQYDQTCVGFQIAWHALGSVRAAIGSFHLVIGLFLLPTHISCTPCDGMLLPLDSHNALRTTAWPACHIL